MLYRLDMILNKAMKKILTLVIILAFGILKTNAQSYDEYLQIAYKHLKDGKIENAQRAYSVYCTMTGQSNAEFEY